MMKGAVSAASVIARPPFSPAGHYYSPLTSESDRERAISRSRRGATDLPGVQYRESEALALGQDLARYWPEMVIGKRYSPDIMYGLADAAIYYAMLRLFQPSRIIEVGSGYSTAVALDTIESFGISTSLTCVEPNASRLRSLLRATDALEIVESPVQDVPLERFSDLARGDFLFIDSTHVAKSGSDVLHDVLHILPELSPGVLVHIHDMFWPFEYKEDWLREGRDWNETYFIHAFLLHNGDWKIRFFADHNWPRLSHLVPAELCSAKADRPGALWLERL